MEPQAQIRKQPTHSPPESLDTLAEWMERTWKDMTDRVRWFKQNPNISRLWEHIGKYPDIQRRAVARLEGISRRAEAALDEARNELSRIEPAVLKPSQILTSADTEPRLEPQLNPEIKNNAGLIKTLRNIRATHQEIIQAQRQALDILQLTGPRELIDLTQELLINLQQLRTRRQIDGRTYSRSLARLLSADSLNSRSQGIQDLRAELPPLQIAA